LQNSARARGLHCRRRIVFEKSSQKQVRPMGSIPCIFHLELDAMAKGPAIRGKPGDHPSTPIAEFFALQG